MKKSTFTFISLLFCISLFAQSGIVRDNLSMKSTILKGERKYAIYLPADYQSSQRSYPVLYLLHGSGDDQTGWVQFGEVLHIADNAIAEGKSTSMIIVMPDANTGQRGYFNSIDGAWNYEDFFFKEFIPYIEKEYRIKGEKRYRAIAGLSMGGGGTFIYALHHPELFSSACPLSAAVGPFTPEEVKSYLEKRKESTNLTDEQLTQYYQQYSVLHLIKNMPQENRNAVRWYIDCGDDDFLYEGNALVHIAMRKAEIEHEYRVRDGRHSWTYWRSSLPEVLDFVSQAFHQN
jgi:S-formylglutathione hydrolase FrmB